MGKKSYLQDLGLTGEIPPSMEIVCISISRLYEKANTTLAEEKISICTKHDRCSEVN